MILPSAPGDHVGGDVHPVLGQHRAAPHPGDRRLPPGQVGGERGEPERQDGGGSAAEGGQLPKRGGGGGDAGAQPDHRPPQPPGLCAESLHEGQRGDFVCLTFLIYFWYVGGVHSLTTDLLDHLVFVQKVFMKVSMVIFLFDLFDIFLFVGGVHSLTTDLLNHLGFVQKIFMKVHMMIVLIFSKILSSSLFIFYFYFYIGGVAGRVFPV